MSKKTKTSSTQTSTPNNPEWVTSSLQGLNSRIGALGQVDPQSYVAGPSALQNQAFTGAQHLGGFDPYAQGAAGLITGSNDLNLDQFQNPFQQQVIDTSLQGFDQNAAMQRAQQQAGAAQTGAFGGSRYGVAQGILGGQQGMDRGRLQAGLEQQGFNTALTAAQAEQNRKLQAAGLMGALGNDVASNQRSDLGVQSALGDQQRSISQDQATAPISLAQALASLYGANQFGLEQGSTTTGSSTSKTSDPLGAASSIFGGLGSAASGIGSLAGLFGSATKTAAGAASGLSAAFSDIRLKTDIRPLGEHKGVKWYDWRYLWDELGTKRVGVMAHEVPQAQVPGPFGFLMVDYSKLEAPAWAS